jgi:hypothetical protein
MAGVGIPTGGLNDRQEKRLKDAMRQSRKDLQQFRWFRRKAIQEYAGFYFGKGTSRHVVSNMIELMVNVFTRQLAANVPRVMVSTGVRSLDVRAQKLQLALNHLLEEIKYGRTHRRFVKSAMFSLGIMKIANERTGGLPDEATGWVYDIGQPYAVNISLDDWVHDTNARVWEEAQFMGHRYRWPLELAKQRFQMSKDDESLAQEPQSKNEDGMEKVASHGWSDTSWRDEYKKHVDLFDIFLPIDNIVATFISDPDGEDTFGSLLGIRDYEGPELGPYVPLSFSDVPDHIMPLTPVMTHFDWHELINIIYRKARDQAERAKTITGFQRSQGDEDAKRIMRAKDGEIVAMDNPDLIREYTFGGVDGRLLAMGQHAFDRFMTMTGNLDALGGLAPQSPTLGQDELLQVNASKRIADMQDQVIEATRQSIKSLAWHLFYNPLIELPLTVEAGGMNITVKFTAADIEGDYLDYNFNVDPFSMQHRTPGSRFQTTMNLLQSVILPGMQDMASQGIGIDWKNLMEQFSEDANLPELSKILRFSSQTGRQEVGQPPVEQRQAPVTRRINERVNRSANTRGAGDNMTEKLMALADKQEN